MQKSLSFTIEDMEKVASGRDTETFNQFYFRKDVEEFSFFESDKSFSTYDNDFPLYY